MRENQWLTIEICRSRFITGLEAKVRAVGTLKPWKANIEVT